MPKQRKWMREETLAAFALHMHMPTNHISYKEDADITALPNALGRSPGSIAIKLQGVFSRVPSATREGFD